MAYNISFTFEAVDDFSPALRKINSEISRLQSHTRRAAAAFRSFGEGLTKFGSKFSLMVGAPLAAFGALAIHTATDYEASMNMVGAVTSATATQLAALRKESILMGQTTQYSARQAASAMKFLGLAGFRTNEIIAAMPETLELAASAQLDMGTAASIVSKIMRGYGATVSDLSHINDVLVTVFTSTNTTLQDLGQGMKMVGPIAHVMGMKIEETAAAIGEMGQAGIPGSMAGTMLRRALIAMAKPSKDASRLMHQLGLKFVDAKGHILPLIKIVKELNAAHITGAQYATLFGIRAGPALAALVGQGPKAIAELIKKEKEQAGISKRIARAQMMGLPGAVMRLRSAFEHLQITIVHANDTLVRKFLDGLTSTILSINEFSPGMQALIGQFGAASIVLGPAAMTIGKIAVGLSILGKNLSKAALRAVGFVAVITGLAIAFIYLYNHFKKVRDLTHMWVIFVNRYVVPYLVRLGDTAIDALKLIGYLVNIFLIKPFMFAYKIITKVGGAIASLFHRTPAAAVARTMAPAALATTPRTALGRMSPVAAGAAAGVQQHRVLSTLNINVNDQNQLIKSLTGQSTADDFGMNIGTNMALSRY